MTNWRPDFNPDHLYFVTTKAVDYAHLLQRDLVKRLLVDVLDCMHLRQQLLLYAFVIMPTHIHLIARFLPEKPVNDWIRDYKKHVADRLIRQYQVENNQQALSFLADKVTRPDKQKYKVWEDGYNAKDIFSPEFLRQKMEYVHYNPCQPHWRLVADPAEYMWSSARFYLTDQSTIIPVENARELMI
ncbi:MAG: transposase [Anaerolineae bacterium]|nr:transposase [Anaerolineae bacterium]